MIKVNKTSYQHLLDLLSDETGLNFQYYREAFIIRRIKARMIRIGLDSLDSYYDYILSNKYIEVKEFIDSFNINYSYFFRNWEVFDFFQDFILKSLNYNKRSILSNLKPKTKSKGNENIGSRIRNFEENRNTANIIRNRLSNRNHNFSYGSNGPNKSNYDNLSFIKKTSIYQSINSIMNLSKKPIYIWSCPCASGEEPYSIAMIMDNLKSQVPDFPEYKIVASDIDRKAIYKAKVGNYSGSYTKDVSNYYENKYFSKKEDYFGYNYTLNEKIKNAVEFVQEDVIEGHKHSWKYDVIFCRYLLIYFNREKRYKFLKILENQLKYGGLLILGKTETIFNSECNFKLVDSSNRIYLKTFSNSNTSNKIKEQDLERGII